MTTTIERMREEAERHPKRVRFSRDQVKALLARGILPKELRYQLIDGDIYLMSENPPHAETIIFLVAWLHATFGSLRVRSQTAIEVAGADRKFNVPFPDAAVTHQSVTAYHGRFPGPGECALVVEVSDTTLRLDLTKKAGLYARAEFLDYWVLDVKGRRLIVHRQPVGGSYTNVIVFGEDESIAPLAAPEAKVRVGELLPERDPASPVSCPVEETL